MLVNVQMKVPGPLKNVTLVPGTNELTQNNCYNGENYFQIYIIFTGCS